MALPSIAVNYWTVLIGGVVSMVLGALWYSPVLFGNQWMKLMGFSEKDLEKAKKKGMGKTYFANFVAALVTAWVLAWFIGIAGASTLGEGVIVGFWVWLGFNAAVLLGGVLWEGRPFNLYLINVSYWLLNFILVGGILGAWS
jgi:hypothetical protein